MLSGPQSAGVEARPYLYALHLLRTLLLSVVVALFITTFIAQAFQIPSGSMQKTLMTGDYLLVDKAVFAGEGEEGDAGGRFQPLPYRGVERGDIIVFHYPIKPETYFVKRVVGVPGDRVRIVDKRLYVNGRAESGDYAMHVDRKQDYYRDNFPELRFAPGNVDAHWWLEMRRMTSSAGELIVPAGGYFVLGDNRDDSQDSRYWGFVPRGNIVGRPLLIYWSRADTGASGVTSARGDTLSGLAYAMTHLHTRWDRVLRTVR
ncbi:MAG: signal peptidase I [Acidobacteriota bacterium]|nr:signal peptidase I [Acidobacteriota bacterium]